MFGSARTVQPTTGLRQLGMLLAAVVLLIALAGAVALGQLFAAKPLAAPAANTGPFVGDGWKFEAVPAGRNAPIADDWKYDISDPAIPATGGFGGWNGPRLGGDGGGSNGIRIAQ
jgi:hypothetical protein